MATTTTKTNKPILPRGADNRPVDSYNRAELYSGKALDFDGFNDYVSTSNISVQSTNVWTYTTNINFTPSTGYWFDARTSNVGYSVYFDSTSQKIILYTTSGIIFDFVFDFSSWYNISITSNGTTAILYVNGISVDSSPYNYSASSTGDFFIGQRHTYGSRFRGQIAGFKIFNTALTAAQVADLYNNPEKVVPTGVDNTALKLWLPMQEGAGTYCINGADPLGDDLYNGAGSFDSATGWTLNTGTSITGGQLVVDGTQTSNTSAYYSISEALPNQLAFVQYTISSISSGSVDMVFFGSNTQSKIRTEVGTYTELVEVITGHNGNTGPRFSSDCVCTIDNLTIKKVDTGKINGATWTHGIGSPIAQTAVIDWNKETTGAGTTMLLPQGLTTGRDITGVNLFENVRKQGALNLDGNSWAEVHDNASLDFGTGSFTLEAWVKADFLSQGSGVNIILSLGGDITSANNSGLVSTSSAFSFWIGGINRFTPAYVSESWNHIVGVRSGSSVIFYFNGAQVATGSSSSSITNSQEKQIGRDETTIRYYPNQIAQPRIYNRALTASEVLNNYNATSSLYI